MFWIYLLIYVLESLEFTNNKLYLPNAPHACSQMSIFFVKFSVKFPSVCSVSRRMFTFKTSIVSGLFAQTLSLRWPHWKLSKESSTLHQNFMRLCLPGISFAINSLFRWMCGLWLRLVENTYHHTIPSAIIGQKTLLICHDIAIRRR